MNTYKKGLNKYKAAAWITVFTAVFLLLLIIGGKKPAYAISGKGTSSNPYDISTGNLNLDADQGGEYYVKGSTDKYRIQISGVDQEDVKQIKLHLTGVSINLQKGEENDDSVEAACITLEGNSNVTIYIDSDTKNKLVGGNEHGPGRDNGHPAIQVDDGGILNLEVWGSLEATGGDGGSDRGAAAIGSRNNDSTCGKINVHVHDNGSLKATGKYGGAGIGGGNNSDTKDINITLDGGARLEAYGGEGGAGIGGGDQGDIPKINIKGTSNQTNLIAQGSTSAAGIGGGRDGRVTSITIDGVGTVTGKGGYKAAGIGAGDHDSTGSGGNFGDLTIKNCSYVEGVGGEAGAGLGGSEDSDVGDITIVNCGEVKATGGKDAAGIGTGRNSNAGKQVDCGDITIKNCKVTAVSADPDGDSDAAGIGGGEAGNIQSITITGEKEITAQGAGQGAGIGCGDDGSCGEIRIESIQTTLTATAGDEYGAGIGACDADCGDIILALAGGTVNATGGFNGAGIGGGDGGDYGSILIGGFGSVNALGGFDAAAIGGGEGESGGEISILGDPDYQTKAHYYDEGAYALKVNARAHQKKETVTNQYAPIIGAKDCGAIHIEDAEVSLSYPAAAAMYGASIGCGKDGSLDSITIRHSKVTQDRMNIEKDLISYNIYGATIGEAYNGDVDTIELEDVEYYGRAIGGATWAGSDIESIKIKNSRIFADAPDTTITEPNPLYKIFSAEPIAGIGSGKDASIGKIEITGSEVTANGKNGGAGIGSGGLYTSDIATLLFNTGGKCGDITISNSNVKAWSQAGGAGIGGGAATSVTGTISVSDSVVDASVGETEYWGVGGAGIGGGEIAGCKAIKITRSTVKAFGGPGSAAIGGGGSPGEDDGEGGVVVPPGWDPEIGNIEIIDSEVTANGGTGGAGIGSGKGTQQTDGCHLLIEDSVVNANGGHFGAGIGGGSNGTFGRGGDFGGIQIVGKSRVIANGGKEAAGIGGGSQGELEGCLIRLDESVGTGKNGNLEPLYYVKAYGGSGAAGIGSGATHCTNSLDTQNYAYLAYDIRIDSGWIYASGGGDMQVVDSMNGQEKQWIGAGAGIGGGAKGGLHGLTITGGVVKTNSQGSNGIPGLNVRQANGIGYGGGDTSILYRNTSCEGFTITGGTVDGGICDEVDVTITGGNILWKIAGDKPEEPRVTNGKANVFRNELNLDVDQLSVKPVIFEGTNYYPVELTDVSSSYATDGIYAKKGSKDKRAQIGLYLPESKKDAAHAKVSGFSDSYYNGIPEYYGTTNKDNNNILRIGPKIALEPKFPEDMPAVNRPFTLLVKSAEHYGKPEGVTYSYTASGSCGPEITDQKGDGKEPYVVVTPATIGDLTVTAAGDGTTDEIYWASEPAQYQAEVTDQPETKDTRLSIDADDKIFDGEAYADLQITANRDQDEVDVSYYRIEETGELTLLDGAPVDVGNYKAVAVLRESAEYDAATAEADFEITQRTVTLSMTKKGNEDNSCDIRVDIGNGVADLVGKELALTVRTASGSAVLKEKEKIHEDGGSFVVTRHFDNVLGGDYTIYADFNADGAYVNYYPASESTELIKGTEEYLVSTESMELVYGGESKLLPVTVTDSMGTIFDPADLNISYVSSDTDVATIDPDGTVHPVHPGISKVTVTAGADGWHKEGKATAIITVQKAEFTPRVVVEDKTYDGQAVSPRIFDVPEDYQGLEEEPVFFYYEKNGNEYEYIDDADVVRDAGEYMVLVVCTRDRNYKHEEAVTTFTISPAPVSVKTGSAEKVYDGKPLTCDEAELTGLIEGEAATIRATGSQTEVGSSSNTYEIAWAGNGSSETAKEKNYTTAKEELGTLTVDPANTATFEIWTYQDLEKMAKDVAEHPETYGSATYQVMCNIKAPEGSSWTKGIGSVTDMNPFTGTLEGNGYCISGLRIDMPEYGGLFEWIGEGGTVQNLYLFDCDYTSPSATGGGIAAVNEGTISYCVNGVNTTTGVYVDPKTGRLIALKEFNSSVSGKTVGGIAGVNRGTIFGCRCPAVVNGTASESMAGGIAGWNLGTIDNCAGNNTLSQDAVLNALAAQTRDASGTSYLGGLSGVNQGTIKGGYSSAVISGDGIKGNLVGSGNEATLTDIFYTTSEGQTYQGEGENASETNIQGKSRGQMMKDAFVDQLKETASNQVSWVRDAALNAGLPRILNPSAAFAYQDLEGSNVSFAGNMHVGAELSVTSLPKDSEVWNLLAEGEKEGLIDSAYVCLLTDGAGNYVPSELWEQSDAVYRFAVKSRNVKAKVLMADGSIQTMDPLTVAETENGLEASFESSGAVSFMILTKENGSGENGSGTNTGDNGESTSGNASKDGRIKTGDTNQTTLFLGLGIAAVLLGTGAIVLYRRKRQ